MSIEPVDTDAVRLMNLHRAKGLEAPIVVLAELSPWRKPEPTRHVARGAAGSRGWFTAGYWMRPDDRAPQWIVTATPPDWESRRAEEAAFEEAEKTRLLYVAATRARDTLVVSLREDKPENGAWAPLRLGLKELPTAVAKLRDPAPARTPPLAAELPDARKRIAEGRLRAATPSFAVTPVTALAKKEGPRAPTAAENARGAAWGRVLHQLLEAAMRTPGVELRPVAENLLREEELGPEFLDEALRVAASVTSSPLWARARAAKRRFVEAPFAMMVRSADLGVSVGPDETLLKGAIDLVFEEDGVWHIVDWKSDAVGDNLAALVAHYAPQVEHYRRAWETLTKQRAIAGLYFMDNGHLEWLEGEKNGTEHRRPSPRPLYHSKKIEERCRRLPLARRASRRGPRRLRFLRIWERTEKLSSNGDTARLYVPKLWAPLMPGSVYPNKHVPVPAKARPSVVVVCPSRGVCPKDRILGPLAERGIVVLLFEGGLKEPPKTDLLRTRPEAAGAPQGLASRGTHG